MNSPNIPIAQSWWQSFQQQIEQVLQRFNLSVRDVVHIVSFVCVGVVIGYVLKKYFKYFFIITLLVVLVLIVLDRFGIIVINWSNMQDLTGINPQSTVQQCVESTFKLIRDNIGLAVSSLIGLIIGYRIG